MTLLRRFYVASVNLPPSTRKIGASKELARREQLAEERENTYDGTQDEDEMEF